MPNEAARLCRVRAAVDDGVNSTLLVLAQHGLPRLVVLDIKEDPVLQGAQEVRALEERLHREPVALFGRLLPSRHTTPVRVPGYAVPVVEQMRDVEQLGRSDQLGRLELVPTKLFYGALDCVAVLRVLVLDNAHGY